MSSRDLLGAESNTTMSFAGKGKPKKQTEQCPFWACSSESRGLESLLRFPRRLATSVGGDRKSARMCPDGREAPNTFFYRHRLSFQNSLSSICHEGFGTEL